MVSTEEKLKFEKICLDIVGQEHALFGIGTYSEKTLHRVLKCYFCPDTDRHEVGIGSFVADAVCDGIIYEIQSAGLFPLKKSLPIILSIPTSPFISSAPYSRPSVSFGWTQKAASSRRREKAPSDTAKCAFSPS